MNYIFSSVLFLKVEDHSLCLIWIQVNRSLARITGLPCVQYLVHSLILSKGYVKAKGNSKLRYLIMPFR